MLGSRFKRPTPAFVVAMIALFVALGGTAGAGATATVPLAKRALVADKAKTALIAENAKKLGGQTSAKVVSGGFVADNVVILALANGPVNESTWGIGLLDLDDAAPANVNLYAICIREWPGGGKAAGALRSAPAAPSRCSVRRA